MSPGNTGLWVIAFVLAGVVGASVKADNSLSVTKGKTPPSLIVIFLDGARWDMLHTNTALNLKSLATTGAVGEMIPVWPTTSAPNHWALATGLYPVHGGVYDNVMWDPQAGTRFDVKNEGWGVGEPIWATAARAGGTSAVIGGWGGVQMDSRSERPSYYIPYEDTCGACAELALGLLDQEETTRPRFLAIYTGEPDDSEHIFGVDSPEAKRAVQRIDDMVGRLVRGLARRGASKAVNILVVADHGQINFGPEEQSVYIDDLIDLSDLVTPPVLSGKRMPIVELWPKAGREAKVYDQLRTAGPHWHVFHSHELPARWHCCDQKRAPPIILTSDPGWSWSVHDGGGTNVVGIHGYDNDVRGMHSLFIAAGPGIRAHSGVDEFDIVNVYSLMATLMDLQAAPSDGSITPFCSLLVHPPEVCALRQAP